LPRMTNKFMSLNVEIFSPSKVLLQEEANEVVAPSIMGEIGLLPQHTHFESLLREGTIRVVLGSGTREFNISGGLCQVLNDKVMLLVDGVE
jgi:F-type H+-transporting ATPase subunit epsilon